MFPIPSSLINPFTNKGDLLRKESPKTNNTILLLPMHIETNNSDNSASFFKFQMRATPSHQGLSLTFTELRADAERRRGSP